MPDDIFSSIPDNVPKAKKEPETKLPNELQGKSAEEVAQILLDEHQKVVTQMKADEFDKTKKPEPKPAAQQQQQQQQQTAQPTVPVVPTATQQKASLYTDPEGFMDEQFAKRTGPFVQSTGLALRGANQQLLKNKIGDGEYGKYGEEIEQFMDKLAPQLQMHPGAYTQAYDFVRSLHLDEIVKEKAATEAAKTLEDTLVKLGVDPAKAKAAAAGEPVKPAEKDPEPAPSLFQGLTGTLPQVMKSTTPASAVGSAGGKTEGKGAKLTEEQKVVAGRMGMDLDEYAEYAVMNTDLISEITGMTGAQNG